MYRFHHREPLDLTVYPEPDTSDRTGTPLSQGIILILISTVASEFCSPSTLEAIEDAEPDAWYHGQVLETVLNEFEDLNPELPKEVGKNIYYSLRSQFMALGMEAPEDVIRTLPRVWSIVTRGDSGEWRCEMVGPGRAHVEAEQPYNCYFELGALQGALEAFDATNVQIDHTTCMREGHPYCTFEVRWEQPTRA